MYVMPDSTASDAAPESAQSDFPHSLKGFCKPPAEFDKSAALAEPGRNTARMQTRRGYTCAFKPPRQFAREQDIAQLGATESARRVDELRFGRYMSTSGRPHRGQTSR
jgi:hypothetical protein